MHTAPPPFTLLECAYRHLTRDLRRALPPPRIEAEREDRDKAAIAQVAALQPGNTAEFEHGALFVVASARAKHSLACADEPGPPPAIALKLTSQANHMMRQANAATRSLLRLQAARRKIEADPQAYDRGERIEHHMTVLMTGAIADQPTVSPDDPESHNHTAEILPRHPAASPTHVTASPAQPGLAPHATRTPLPVSLHDPESRTPETETRPRHSAPIRIPITASPAKPGVAAQASSTPSPVSPYDPESRTTEAETHPRHPAPAPTQRWRPARPGYDFPLSDLLTEDAV